MERVPEPELMNNPAQARAYAQADFSEPHSMFIDKFKTVFPDGVIDGYVLDLGCGTADITVRFAEAYPNCRLDGADGAEPMLRFGQAAVVSHGLSDRIRLIHGHLPGAKLPRRHYDVLICNSLLHHVNEGRVLWEAVRMYTRQGGAVFVMDLLRPETSEAATRLVAEYAGGEPDILRRDFYNSLCAAYRPDEVREQLTAASLSHLTVEIISDRHLIAYGHRY